MNNLDADHAPQINFASNRIEEMLRLSAAELPASIAYITDETRVANIRTDISARLASLGQNPEGILGNLQDKSAVVILGAGQGPYLMGFRGGKEWVVSSGICNNADSIAALAQIKTQGESASSQLFADAVMASDTVVDSERVHNWPEYALMIREIFNTTMAEVVVPQIRKKGDQISEIEWAYPATEDSPVHSWTISVDPKDTIGITRRSLGLSATAKSTTEELKIPYGTDVLAQGYATWSSDAPQPTSQQRRLSPSSLAAALTFIEAHQPEMLANGASPDVITKLATKISEQYVKSMAQAQ